jgi:hypothetical protein
MTGAASYNKVDFQLHPGWAMSAMSAEGWTIAVMIIAAIVRIGISRC